MIVLAMIVLKQRYRISKASRIGLPVMAAGLMALAGALEAQQPKAAAPSQSSAAQVTSGQNELDVTGVWIDHTKRGAIEIVPCGERVCGYVYWVKDPVARNGKPVVDANNPDPARRGKPMCGTQILVNVAQKGRGRFGHIWGASDAIYSPEEGKNFDVELKLTSPNELSVTGFIGIKLFGEQFTWTRAPADLARCGPARV